MKQKRLPGGRAAPAAPAPRPVQRAPAVERAGAPLPASAVAGAVLLIVAVGVACYANSLHAPFTLDDEPGIVQNPFIRHVASRYDLWLLWRWSAARFVTNLTFAANYAAGGLQVTGYHAVNVGIHVATACLLLWLALLLQETPALRAAPAPAVIGAVPGRLALAAFAALLFVAHPVQTEAVTYVVQRAASLAGLLYVLGLALYVRAGLLRVRQPRRGAALWLCAAATTFALGMLTKQTVATLPAAVLLVEVCFFPPAGERRGWRAAVSRRAWGLAGLFAVIALAGAVILLARLGRGGVGELFSAGATASRADYLRTQIDVVRTYVRLLFLPVGQNLDYDYPVTHTLWTLPTLLSAGVLLGFMLLAVRTARRWPLVAFGIAFFFLTLAVESSVIPLPDVIFEHRLYIPSMGFALAVSGGVFAVLRDGRAAGSKRLLGGAAMVLAVVALAAATVARNAAWADPVRLWTDVVHKSPRKARAHHDLALAYQGAGRLSEAAAEYQAALALDPSLAKSWNNLGNVEQRLGNLQEAEHDYGRALALDRRFVDAYSNLAFLYLQARRLDAAEKMIYFASLVAAGDSEVQRAYGKFAYLKNDLPAAVLHDTLAIRANPNNADAHVELAVVYLAQGRVDDAAAECRRALQLNPRSAEAYTNLGNALARRNDLAGAEAAYRNALRLAPRQEAAYFNLGLVYQVQHRWPEAAATFRSLLTIQPDSAQARAQLAAVEQHLKP